MRRGIGRLRAGGGQTGPTTANMVAWHRKGIGITSASGAVSIWADQTGLGGRDYAQATGAAQPALQGDGTILWNGSSHVMKTPTFALAQGYTRYLRFRQVTWTAGRYVLDGFTANSGEIYMRSVSPTLTMSTTVDGPSSTDATVNTYVSLAAVFNGASSTFNVNGVISAPSTPGAVNPAGLTLGGDGGGAGSFSNIQVAEEIVYSVVHDAATQASIIAYLNTL